jgi:hypothetical protein
VRVNLILETRDAGHIAEIQAALRASGIAFNA